MQVNETNENKEFTPLIVAFCCNWCSYAGADLAGSSRLKLSGKCQDYSCTMLLPCKSAVHFACV